MAFPLLPFIAGVAIGFGVGRASGRRRGRKYQRPEGIPEFPDFPEPPPLGEEFPPAGELPPEQGGPLQMECPPGMVWDESVQSCVHEAVPAVPDPAMTGGYAQGARQYLPSPEPAPTGKPVGRIKPKRIPKDQAIPGTPPTLQGPTPNAPPREVVTPQGEGYTPAPPNAAWAAIMRGETP